MDAKQVYEAAKWVMKDERDSVSHYDIDIHKTSKWLIEAGCGHFQYKTQTPNGNTFWLNPETGETVELIPDALHLPK